MKNAKFNFRPTNKNYEVYNTTEGAYHCVELKRDGTRKSPNKKTLNTFKVSEFERGVNVGAIVIF